MIKISIKDVKDNNGNVITDVCVKGDDKTEAVVYFLLLRNNFLKTINMSEKDFRKLERKLSKKIETLKPMEEV